MTIFIIYAIPLNKEAIAGIDSAWKSESEAIKRLTDLNESGGKYGCEYDIDEIEVK